MSPKIGSISLGQARAKRRRCRWVARPGGVPIKSWAYPLEDGTSNRPPTCRTCRSRSTTSRSCPTRTSATACRSAASSSPSGRVVPYAIGVDIGCGVAARRDRPRRGQPDARRSSRGCCDRIQRGVPTGFSSHASAPRRSRRSLERSRTRSRRSVRARWVERALGQLGTLGGGNHFLEVQRDEAGRSTSCSTPVRGASASDLRRVPQAGARAGSRRWHAGPAEPGARVPAGSTRTTRRLLGGDGVRPPLRGGEPLAGCWTSRRPRSRRTRRSGASSGWSTSTTTTRPAKRTSVGTASSTARAPCGPGPATRS